MEINIKPKPYYLFNAFNLFFIIHSVQVGMGLPGFQRIVLKESGHDAWISVIIAGIASHIAVMIIIATLKKYESADIFGIHYDIYGKWLSKVMSSIHIVYYALAATVLFRGYIEVIQSWLFPELPTWIIGVIGGIIVLYAVLGGIRVVVGVSVLSVILTTWLTTLIYFPLQYAEWINLLPILEAPPKDLLMGAYKMTYTIIGFEVLYIIYPYIKEKKKASFYTHLSLLYTSLIYVVVMIVTIVYFCKELLLKTIWPTFSMFKIIQFPFLERFEIIAISLWMILILPNAILPLWIASKGIKRVYGIKQKYGLYFIFVFLYIAQLLIKTRDQMNIFYDWFANFGFFIVFIYPIILYILVSIIHKRRRKKGIITIDETKSPS